MGLVANSRDLSLFDLLQVKGMARETCRIAIGGRGGHGVLTLRDGIVVHATYRELRGANAALAILAQTDVEYTVRSEIGAIEPNMTETTQSLVMEASRRFDEERRSGARAVAPARPSGLDRRCYAVVAAGALGGVAAFFLVMAVGRAQLHAPPQGAAPHAASAAVTRTAAASPSLR